MIAEREQPARGDVRPPVNLVKPSGERAAAEPAGPAWIVLPVRVIALVVVLPVRLAYDLLLLLGRGIRTGWRGLKRTPRAIGRLLAGLGRAFYNGLLRPVGSGAAWLWRTVVVLPLNWFGEVVLAPIGRVLLALGHILLLPLRALGQGLSWLGGVTALVLKGLVTAVVWLITMILVKPAILLWQYVLRPPLMGLVWLGNVVGAALGWSWQIIGRVLYYLVVPAVAIGRYVLRPIGQGVAGTWRLASRCLRWLWLHLVAAPARAVWRGTSRGANVLVIAPARWTKASVLRPAGTGLRHAWRASVREPARWVHQTVVVTTRETGREIRLQLRRAFRGG